MVKHIAVTGEVQGVGFRYSMYYAAKNFGVTGWVRNRSDGSVEAMAQGTDEALAQFIDWAHKGPGMSRVEYVEVIDGEGEFQTFEILATV